MALTRLRVTQVCCLQEQAPSTLQWVAQFNNRQGVYTSHSGAWGLAS